VTLEYLLDTTIVSAPVARVPNPRLVKRLQEHGPRCAIAAPVWHELVYGTTRLAAGKRREALEAYLEDVVRRSFPILGYDEAAAAWHGRERARLEELGKTPPFVDGQIAAIAASRGMTLVTGNLKHFESFSRLSLVDWGR
jgi:tRNA(fMet)-specific endonuclease VapC